MKPPCHRPAPPTRGGLIRHSTVRRTPSARPEIEIAVHMSRENADVLSILDLLERHDLTVLTWNCVADDAGRVVLLTTEYPEKAQRALAEAGYHCGTKPVVVVGPINYSTGFVNRLHAALRNDAVAIHGSYLSATEAGQIYMVLNTTDDRQAVRTIRHRLAMGVVG
jgi:hypothetical protein